MPVRAPVRRAERMVIIGMKSTVTAGMVDIHVVMPAVIGVAVVVAAGIHILMNIYVLLHRYILMHIHAPVKIMIAKIAASPVDGVGPWRLIRPVKLGLTGCRLGRRLWTIQCRLCCRLRAAGGWGPVVSSRAGLRRRRSGPASAAKTASANAAVVKSLGHNEPGTARQGYKDEYTYNFTIEGIFHDGEL